MSTPNLTKAQREAVSQYTARRMSAKSGIERIAIDNEWVDGMPLGLLAMAVEPSPEDACMHDECDKRATTFQDGGEHWHDWIWCDEHASQRNHGCSSSRERCNGPRHSPVKVGETCSCPCHALRGES